MSDSVTDVEIGWTLKNVLSFSFHSFDGLSGLFKAMFPDSVVAGKFSLQKDKCALTQLWNSSTFPIHSC